jgi:hypothetical protein
VDHSTNKLITLTKVITKDSRNLKTALFTNLMILMELAGLEVDARVPNQSSKEIPTLARSIIKIMSYLTKDTKEAYSIVRASHRHGQNPKYKYLSINN